MKKCEMAITIDRLMAENERLAKMFAENTYIVPTNQDPGYFNIALRGEGAMLLIGQLIHIFRESGGVNFLTNTLQLTLPDGKTRELFELTIQKVDGADSPAMKIERLMAENQELKGQIVKLKRSFEVAMIDKPRSIEFSWVGATCLYPGQRQAPWEYYLNLAQMAATRSPCLKRRVGAVLVRDNRVVATGYNGPASGLSHCQECKREISGQGLQDCRATHEEENAILQCALYGPSTIGASMYCTHAPCYHCAKLIIQAKIVEVSYIESYPDGRGLELLEEAKIHVAQFDRQGRT
jgi:dCMP deaminase